jgi:glycosyltransferase involved in cell wall biosynthesis
VKIVFLVTRLEKPSARYRVLQYIPFLENAGYKTRVEVIPKNPFDRLVLFMNMREADMVFLQKKLFSLPEWHILRKFSKKLIYDFDDAVMFRDSGNQDQRRMKNFLRTVREADMVIAGNDYLNSFSAKENPRTTVLPTSIDVQRYAPKNEHIRTDHIVLGWIGSRATLGYLERMKGVCDAVFDRFPHVRLKIVADAFFDCDRIPVIKKPWSHEEEIEDLHTFDIGLMPLTDDPWSRGKCGFKLLQYMAVGIPVVCSPVGANRTIVSDGIDGFHAVSDEEWIEKIGYLAENAEIRMQMGKQGREKVNRFYSVEANSRKLLSILDSLNA